MYFFNLLLIIPFVDRKLTKKNFSYNQVRRIKMFFVRRKLLLKKQTITTRLFN